MRMRNASLSDVIDEWISDSDFFYYILSLGHKIDGKTLTSFSHTIYTYACLQRTIKERDHNED